MPEFWIFDAGRTGWSVTHSRSERVVVQNFADAMAAADKISLDEYERMSRNCIQENERTGTEVMATRLTTFLERWL
jgi:hypothetical protein